jgi:hypothetical protein
MTTPTEKVATAKVEAIVEEFIRWAETPARPEDETKTFTENIADWLHTTLTQTIEECEAEKREMVREIKQLMLGHCGKKDCAQAHCTTRSVRRETWKEIEAIAAKYIISKASE